MKNSILVVLAALSLMFTSCYPVSYPYGHDLGRYHYGKGNGYHGKYRGRHHRYNWNRKDHGYNRNYHAN
jgi:hypothetical protein